MFIFPEPITVWAGDTLTGSITITRNVSYRRHFHSAIAFSHQLTGKEGGSGSGSGSGGSESKAAPAPASPAAASHATGDPDVKSPMTGNGSVAVSDLGATPSVEQITNLKLGTAKQPLFHTAGAPRVAKDYEFRYDMWR